MIKILKLINRRRKPVNRDLIDVKRRQKFVEMELRHIEATIARGRRGPNQ